MGGISISVGHRFDDGHGHNDIHVAGKKETQKLYYRHSGTPGGMKVETFKGLKNRIPVRILEKAIWGMLPKGVLGRQYFRRLYIYSDHTVRGIKSAPVDISSDQWIKVP